MVSKTKKNNISGRSISMSIVSIVLMTIFFTWSQSCFGLPDRKQSVQNVFLLSTSILAFLP